MQIRLFFIIVIRLTSCLLNNEWISTCARSSQRIAVIFCQSDSSLASFRAATLSKFTVPGTISLGQSFTLGGLPGLLKAYIAIFCPNTHHAGYFKEQQKIIEMSSSKLNIFKIKSSSKENLIDNIYVHSYNLYVEVFRHYNPFHRFEHRSTYLDFVFSFLRHSFQCIRSILPILPTHNLLF